MHRYATIRALSVAAVTLMATICAYAGPSAQTATAAAPAPVPAPAKYQGFIVSGLKSVRPNPAPYQFYLTDTLPALADPTRPVNAAGVLQTPWPGQAKPVYHPVAMSWYTISMLESYRINRNPDYLQRAVVNARALIDGGVRTPTGELWFPYRFDYLVHNDRALATKAPWYSGMAQGLALSVTSRLWELTGNPQWKTEAIAIAKTYRVGQRTDAPWFAYVDASGYLWFEEYPAAANKLHVVNGHIYAAWGIVDYLAVVAPNDTQLAREFDGAMTALRNNFGQYRAPGKPSYYCISPYCRATSWQPADYHRGVVYQLGTIGSITADPTFFQQSSLLKADYPAFPAVVVPPSP